MTTINPERLVDFVAAVYAGEGVPEPDARLLADTLVQADLWGHQSHGIGAVGVRNSNHFGTCMYYTLMGAREGCVTLLTTNGGPAMAPWGGRKKIVGTNPWSVAAPAGSRAPI